MLIKLQVAVAQESVLSHGLIDQQNRVFSFPICLISKIWRLKTVEFTLEKTQKIPILFPISWSKNGETSSPEKKNTASSESGRIHYTQS